MRIAYLECFSGISGDMFMGALIDAGVPPEVFIRTVEALSVDARLEIRRVDRSGISATKVDVIAAERKSCQERNSGPKNRLNMTSTPMLIPIRTKLNTVTLMRRHTAIRTILNMDVRILMFITMSRETATAMRILIAG